MRIIPKPDGRFGLKRGVVGGKGEGWKRTGEGGVVRSPGIRGVPRWRRRVGGRRVGEETITRSDILRRTMRCNSLYPVEGEPSPISATKLCRLNSHDRSHYLPPPLYPLALRGTSQPARIIFTDLPLRARPSLLLFPSPPLPFPAH